MSDFTENIDLPENWILCTFEDVSEGENAIVDGPFGSNLKTSDYIDDKINGVPVLTTKNLEGDYSDDKVRFISKEKFEELKRSQVNPGDIVVAKIGSIGKNGTYPKNGRTAIIPANLLKFTVSKKVAFNYVYQYLNFIGLQNKIKDIATATAQPAFNVTKFRQLEIPLPPLPEQHRIVAKIEEFFSSLDKGIESLKMAEQQLEIYRQAVLGKAFEGAFTTNWRKEYSNANANKEFENIKEIREELYTQKIEEWTLACEKAKLESTKKPTKPKKPYAGEPISKEEKANFDVIDKTWALVRFIDLIKYEEDAIKRGPFGSAIKKSFFVPTGYKVYEQQNAISDDATLGKYYISEEKYQELIGFSIKPGDYIVSCSGTIGRISKLPENCEPGVINQALMKIRLDVSIR